MKRLLQRLNLTAEDGFSLAELMTVTMLLGVILSAAYLALGTVNKVSDDMMARTTANDQGQAALETMVRELRQGVIIYQNSDPYKLPTMTSNSVAFYTDIDRDGNIEKVNYNVAGGLLTRAIARSNKPNPTPSDFGSYGTPTTLANVDPNDATIFRYTDAASPPNFLSSDAQASAVLIDLTTVAKTSAGSTVTVVFPTAEADVRSW